MRTYIKPEFEVTSIFAQENIASVDGTDLFAPSHKYDGGSSIYIENDGDKGWNLWDD